MFWKPAFLKHDHRDGLLRRLPRHSIGAEIGVYQGEFSALVLRRLRPAHLYLIDPWQCRQESVYRSGWYGADHTTQTDLDAMYQSVRHRFTGPRVSVHRKTSEEMVDYFPNSHLDWVYVDGDHQFEAVEKDFALYLPKLKPGGYLCGDDYDNPGWWQDGVTRAVQNFLGRHVLKTVLIENHQFLLQI